MNDKFQIISIGLIFLLIGFIIGFYVGQISALNWCAQKAVDFLNVKGFDVTLNGDRIRAVVTEVLKVNPNGTGRVNMWLNKLG